MKSFKEKFKFDIYSALIGIGVTFSPLGFPLFIVAIIPSIIIFNIKDVGSCYGDFCSLNALKYAFPLVLLEGQVVGAYIRGRSKKGTN